jgi:hypothetical protein
MKIGKENKPRKKVLTGDAYVEAASDVYKHALLMKGTVDFNGFMAKEVYPNKEFYHLFRQPARPRFRWVR